MKITNLRGKVRPKNKSCLSVPDQTMPPESTLTIAAAHPALIMNN